MKLIIAFLFWFLLVSCTTTKLKNIWKSPEVNVYNPQKVLVIGLTQNKDARVKFENLFTQNLLQRDVEAISSNDYLGHSKIEELWLEHALMSLENKLIDDGFDTIIINKITDVEETHRYKRDFSVIGNSYMTFKDDVLMNQDTHQKPSNQENFLIYHTEITVYCVCIDKERQLIWKGNIDIKDPKSTQKTIKGYIKRAISELEKQNIIPPEINKI